MSQSRQWFRKFQRLEIKAGRDNLNFSFNAGLKQLMKETKLGSDNSELQKLS